MPSEWHPAWLVLQMLGYWQTLIAGLLAVGAAVFTIRATVRSADREIEAANRQIRTAQRQIDITLTLDRRRTADETHAFLVAVEFGSRHSSGQRVRCAADGSAIGVPGSHSRRLPGAPACDKPYFY